MSDELQGIIRWEDPPPVLPRGRTNRNWGLIIHELKQKPGEWAYLGEVGQPTIKMIEHTHPEIEIRRGTYGRQGNAELWLRAKP